MHISFPFRQQTKGNMSCFEFYFYLSYQMRIFFFSIFLTNNFFLVNFICVYVFAYGVPSPRPHRYAPLPFLKSIRTHNFYHSFQCKIIVITQNCEYFNLTVLIVTGPKVLSINNRRSQLFENITIITPSINIINIFFFIFF